MIIVLADDFSGAAEIAGIARSYGLSAEISLDRMFETKADLLVIDSNTRVRTREEAARIVSVICGQIRQQKPDWIFMKIDSVLRGHIQNELQSAATALDRTGVLIVPANPSQGRILTSGIYKISGIPLNQTAFVGDPDFPRHSAKISDLLPGVRCLKQSADQCADNKIPAGLAVAEAAEMTDLRFWAECLTMNILPAGAADFFKAILETKNYRRQPQSRFPDYRKGKIRLILLGSRTSAASGQRPKKVGKKYAYCPLNLALSADHADIGKHINHWIDQIVTVLNQGRSAIALIPNQVKGGSGRQRAIIEVFSKMTAAVNQMIPVEELIIEGGSTASQVLRELRWKGMQPVLELADGVVVMKVTHGAEAQLVVKPGSYAWPAQIWQEN